MMPRFEIKGIRSWSERRRARGGTPARGRGAASDHPGTGELQDLLEAYDRRFQEVATRERDDRERRARFRDEAGRLLESVIVPVLVELGERIAEHGHAWNVESRIDIQGQPAVGCSFSPRETGGSEGPTSELNFRFQWPNRLVVTAAAPNGNELRELAPRSYEMGNVTETTVREEIVRFVRRALAETV